MRLVKLIRPILPKRFLLAVSMGTDSLSAWHYLRSKGFDFKTIHFNHKCANNANADLAVKSFLKYGGDFVGERSDGGGTTENAMRDSRLNFYRDMAKSTGIQHIVTAHHLDDWIENYLMHCFRGQPGRKPFELVADFGDFKIVHPFLLTPKAAFSNYCLSHGLYMHRIEDSTNKQVEGSRRNWLRSKIVPELDKAQISLRKYAQRAVGELITTYHHIPV
jgi:tRNA(Ile)-lysidine synthase